METKITLMIDKEMREVIAQVTKFPFYTAVRVLGQIEGCTTQGGKKHTLSVDFQQNSSGIYNIIDAINITYPGMRGNGYAKRSSFRYIGFINK